MSAKNIIENNILVLVDKRTGNANQAIALANSLASNYKIIDIEYNHFAKLPSSILSLWPMHVKKSSLSQIDLAHIPKIIISSGRRPAALAVHLRRLSKGQTKIIQIMKPNIRPEEFEMIVLPQHDTFNKTLPNIVRVIGALNDVKKRLSNSEQTLKLIYPELKSFIAVIVGGSSKNFTFTRENGMTLCRSILQLSNSHSKPLFITFSRRTPNSVKDLFRDKFHFPHTIYDPDDNTKNPYPAIIGAAEYIITTTDSVSMCCEAAATGKPIYAFCPDNFQIKKHRFFLQQLIDLGIIRKLDPNITYLEKYTYQPLDEVSKVAKIVQENILKLG